ncbi:MAG: M48 family metalloprotease [Pyrinomonadaceae bacterium]|nr:M48 family metalloprotease [Pyrinomonadaceae bacterium]
MSFLQLRVSRCAATIMALAISLAPFTTALAQQKQGRESAQAPSITSTLSSILSLGSNVLTPAARTVQSDPYYQFRNQRYTNEGLISERDEIALGNQLHVEIAKKYRMTNEGQTRANAIGQRVARASQRANIPYRFHVVQSNDINAFSIPGGHIYITSGLMRLANDDELASVLSHEVGHVVARHSLKTLQASQFLNGIADLLGSIAGIAGDDAGQLGTAAARIVASGVLATHNREEEREADFLGVRAMPRAGFKSDGMITMFQKLLRISETNHDLLGSLFNDHPDVEERILNTRYEVNRMNNQTRTRGRR